MDAGGPPAAKTPRRPLVFLAGALVFLVAAACVVIWARYRVWVYSLGCLLGFGAVALGFVGAVTSRKGKRWLPIVIAVLGGVAVVASTCLAFRASWLVTTGAVPVSAPGVSKPFVVVTSKSVMWWPQVSGHTVVWMDERNGPPARPYENRDIYGYDLLTRRELVICTAPGSQSFPAISGDTVVWTDARHVTKRHSRGGRANYDIYGYDLSTRREFPICTARYEQDGVAVSGDTVVWCDARRGPQESGIYGYDLAGGREFPICTAAGQQDSPAVSGRFVVWVDYRHHPYSANGYDTAPCEIYGYDLVARRSSASARRPTACARSSMVGRSCGAHRRRIAGSRRSPWPISSRGSGAPWRSPASRSWAPRGCRAALWPW